MVSSLSQTNTKKIEPLGIFTKSDAIVATQRFQRFHNYILQDQSAKLLPHERVCNCLKKRIDREKKRLVMFNESREKAHWGNLQRCGSIWQCPVCAKTITEKRRNELKKACDLWLSEGKALRLLTLTNPHSASTHLKGMILAQRDALKRFFTLRAGRELLSDLGRVHQVRAMEVTYGENGWHPHFHILLFCEKVEMSVQDESDLMEKLLKHWQNCCVKSKLPMPNHHGLDLRGGDFASDYISKFGIEPESDNWGFESELTKGHIKRGRKNSYTPFDLLQLSIDDDLVHGRLPSKLFQDFAISFKGHRQLVWSRGMKKYFGIDEKSDEELADETEECSIVLQSVEKIVFDILKKYQKRHEYLSWVEEDYKNGVFGCGITEIKLNELIMLEISQFEDYEVTYLKERSIIQ